MSQGTQCVSVPAAFGLLSSLASSENEFSPFGQQSTCEYGVSAPVVSVQLCGPRNDLEKPGCGFHSGFSLKLSV